MSERSLDRKLANIRANPSTARDFILADAKDADMAAGMAAPGQSPEHHASEGRFRTLAEYRELIRENVRQGLVDIMLVSASTSELLTIHERLFDQSHVTPACRANDTSDIWLAAGGAYPEQPARPFRTATIDHMMCGRAECEPGQRSLGVDLGLYSVTFNNDVEHDHETLANYRAFRIEAERKGFRHFLEVFNPNACVNPCPEDIGRYLNDQIARTLAGVTGAGRPIFLKIPFHGRRAMEELVSYDPNLVVGILGGSAGTTFDAFHQLHEARQSGARAALYGRMINSSEHQPTFIQHLRWIADGALTDPAEGVRSYHAALEKLNVRPWRALEDDLKATRRESAYGAGGTSGAGGTGGTSTGAAASSNGSPDFSQMSQAEKIEWNLRRWRRVLDA